MKGVLLAALALLALALAACGSVADNNPGPASGSESTPTREPKAPTPNFFMTDLESREDVLEMFSKWADQHRTRIDEETLVLFTYPEAMRKKPGGITFLPTGAILYHVPSTSRVYFDMEGDVRSRHYESDPAHSRLEEALGNEGLKEEIKARIEAAWPPEPPDAYPTATPTPHSSFTPAPPSSAMTALCEETQGTSVEIEGKRISLHKDLCISERDGDVVTVRVAGGRSYAEVNIESGEHIRGGMSYQEVELFKHFEPIVGHSIPKTTPSPPTPTPEATTTGP